MKPWRRVCIRYASGGPGVNVEPPTSVKKSDEKVEKKSPPTPPPSTPPPVTTLANKINKQDDSADKRSGVLTSVMASLMKKDMRAAYECSMLPPDQQKEFLAHIREIEELNKKHELQKFKEQTSADVEIAKIKSDAGVEEIRAKREADEELAITKHTHQVEILRRKIDAEKEIRSANWRNQKWKAIAERERRQTISAENVKNNEDHQRTLKEVENKAKLRSTEIAEQIELQNILHKQAMELETAKASAAKQRLQENNSAIQLGPSSDIQELREHEMELAKKNHDEKEAQRSHEWKLHQERLQAAEEATMQATNVSKKSLARDTVWRVLQLGVAVGALATLVYYDQLRKKQDEESEYAKWLEMKKEREEAVAREQAVHLEEVNLRKTREAADIEIATLAQKKGEADLLRSSQEYETKLLAVEEAKVLKEAEEIRLQYLESVKKHASTAAGVFLVFVLMWKVGQGPNTEG